MSGYVVIDHVKDDAPDLFAGVEDPIQKDGTIKKGKKLPGGVYRIAVGIPIYEDVPIDEVVDPNPNSEDPIIEEARTEQVLVGYEDVREFLFAEADDRWKGKTADEIAAAQRDLIRASLEPDPSPSPSTGEEPMPGVGGDL